MIHRGYITEGLLLLLFSGIFMIMFCLISGLKKNRGWVILYKMFREGDRQLFAECRKVR